MLIDSHMFFNTGTPFLASAVALATVRNDMKKVWAPLALVGGILYFIGGYLSSNPGIMSMEVMYSCFNAYGIYDAYWKSSNRGTS
jgi:hypothetical protein